MIQCNLHDAATFNNLNRRFRTNIAFKIFGLIEMVQIRSNYTGPISQLLYYQLYDF